MTRKPDPATKEARAIALPSISGFRDAQKPAALDAGSPSRSARRSRASTSTSASTPGTTLTQPATPARSSTRRPKARTRLRELLANWERFCNESRESIRCAHGGPALPVRGHPSISGRQRPHRPHPEHPELDPGRLLDLPTLYLSRYILKTRAATTIACSAVTSTRSGSRGALHACGRRGDVACGPRRRSKPSGR